MRKPAEREFTTHDGSRLFYRYWPALSQYSTGAIVLFHRGHEHSGRLQHLVDELELRDYAMFAWDARGHGRSPGARGFSPSFGTSVRDVDGFVKHVSSSYQIPLRDIALIAQSVGAVLAATWVHDYAPKLRGLVLAAPAFKVKLYVPFARQGLALQHKLRGDFFINSYVKARFLTHDPQRIASYESDPLIARAISVNILLGLRAASDRIVADAQAITLPTQLLISGRDWVVQRAPQEAFFDRLGATVKEKHIFEDFFHDTLGERDRSQAIALIRDFIERLFAAPPSAPSLLNADRSGYTFDEKNTLEQPLPALSAKAISFAITRKTMRTIGQLSAGLQLGQATGYDSGSTLDYVYQNKARGRWGLGRLIDRNYLDAIGWRGIRIRKRHIEQLIALAMNALRAVHRPVHIVDIAAGLGRYALEAATASVIKPDSIRLRDYSEISIRAGTALIAAKGLQSIARFELADGFDDAALAALRPRPTLAIASGFYELFPENEPVGRSLAGLAGALDAGSYLVYTGQPWHPQLEFIARTLTSHRGNAKWIMRRRTQDELDQLVTAAGFRKVDQLIDEWGIFTVSLAVRNA